MNAIGLLGGSDLGLESQVLGKRSVVVEVLQVASIPHDSVLGSSSLILFLVHVGETPLLGNNDLLSTGKLVSRSSKSLHDDGSVGFSSSDREQDLTNVDSGDGVVWLSPSSSHTSLEPIGTGTGQHLVDSDDVVRVNSDPQVEGVLSGSLGNVLVGTDSSSF